MGQFYKKGNSWFIRILMIIVIFEIFAILFEYNDGIRNAIGLDRVYLRENFKGKKKIIQNVQNILDKGKINSIKFLLIKI